MLCTCSCSSLQQCGVQTSICYFVTWWAQPYKTNHHPKHAAAFISRQEYFERKHTYNLSLKEQCVETQKPTPKSAQKWKNNHWCKSKHSRSTALVLESCCNEAIIMITIVSKQNTRDKSFKGGNYSPRSSNVLPQPIGMMHSFVQPHFAGQHVQGLFFTSIIRGLYWAASICLACGLLIPSLEPCLEGALPSGMPVISAAIFDTCFSLSSTPWDSFTSPGGASFFSTSAMFPFDIWESLC